MISKVFILSVLIAFTNNAICFAVNLPNLDILQSESVENSDSHVLRVTRQTMPGGGCRTHAGETGICRPLAYCRSPDMSNNVWRVLNQLCVLNQNEVGVCCTESMQANLITSFVDHQMTGANNERACGSITSKTNENPDNPLAPAHSWPWMAVILRVGWPHAWCGGSLISERYVMTVAHCVYKIPYSEIFVRLGEYNTHVLNETRARDFKMENVKTHEDYDPLTYLNDIAIIRLDKSAFFNTYIWPICMPPTGEQWAGKLGVVAGWGTQTFGGKFPNLLQEVLLPIWNQQQCENTFVERIVDTVLCAGVPSGGQDSCQGDSGGPLMHELPNGRWVVIGVVSWGVGCGQANHPGIYTRVDKYLQWIIHNSYI